METSNIEESESEMPEKCVEKVETEAPEHNIDNESFLQNIDVVSKEEKTEADAMDEITGGEDNKEDKKEVAVVPIGDTDMVSNGSDEKGEGVDKYSKEDEPRRVLIKNINRKKTADEVEDYVFDNYSECGVEEVFPIMANSSYGTKNKWFTGNAIITFETVEKAKEFLAMEFKNETEINYKKKLVKISLEESIKKREERLKETKETQSATSTSGGGDTGKSKTVICAGFEGVSMNPSEIHNYMVMNHESVADVKMDQGKTYITFEDQRSADRFLSLAYVKFKVGDELAIQTTRNLILDLKMSGDLVDNSDKAQGDITKALNDERNDLKSHVKRKVKADLTALGGTPDGPKVEATKSYLAYHCKCDLTEDILVVLYQIVYIFAKFLNQKSTHLSEDEVRQRGFLLEDFWNGVSVRIERNKLDSSSLMERSRHYLTRGFKELNPKKRKATDQADEAARDDA